MRSGTGRVAALDVGFKKIGIAISDPLGLFAKPLTIIYRKDNLDTFLKIEQILRDYGVTTLVIGVPLSSSGEETKMSEKIRKFGEKLEEFLSKHGLKVDVIYRDEYLTTEEAREICRGKDRDVDDVAAAVILRDYLNEVTE